MAERKKIASVLGPFSPCVDRFVPGGYHDPMSLDEQVEAAARIEGLDGLVLVWPGHFREASEVTKLLEKHRLEFATLEMGLYADRRWKDGFFTSADTGLRREAIASCKRGLDVAADAGAHEVLLWPGQDGFDYPFQADYDRRWTLLLDGIGEVASHRPETRIALEYKKAEPRTNIHIRNAGVLLFLLRELNLPNLGAVVDLGHSLYTAENPAEAAVLTARAGKLFQIHLNDNYRDWDHDLMVGSVNFWETLEFFYWVERMGYDGWYQIDSYPYREDGPAALAESVRRTRDLMDRAHALQGAPLSDFLRKSDAVKATREVWERALGSIGG